MNRVEQETAITDNINDDNGTPEVFDIIGQDPEIQAGMDANASDIQIPTTVGWNPAEIRTDYRNTGTFDDVFPELFERVYGHAKYELNRLGMRPELVAEVVQIASEKAKLNWDKYTQGTYALAWFKKIVTNTCFNLRRQLRNRDNREIQIGDAVEFFDGLGFQNASAEKQAIENLRVEEIRAMFDLLPSDLRDAAKAVILDQMTTAEAATFLGIKPATLLTRVHRARTRLREMLNAEHGTDKEI
jgi:RNA polymerase sigma-70 factor (ECF subfamily)